jgi:hypothetical protein
VLLALLSGIWNYSISVVLGISVAITWWRCASRGTTLESLHYIWDQGGLNIISALRAGFHARIVVLLALLVTAVQIINNPLLQRSTHIVAEDDIFEDSMMVHIAPQLPDGWLGSIQNASTANIIGSRNGISDIQAWWWNETIFNNNATGYQCDGRCEGKVRATGLASNCTSRMSALDYSAQENVGSPLFVINTTLSTNSTGSPVLVLTSLYASAIDNSCMATITVDTCTIEAAIVEYPIVIRNTTVSLNKDKLRNMTIISKYASAGDFPTTAKGQGAGVLEGLNDFFGTYMAANATLLIDKSRGNTLYTGGLIEDLFFLTEAGNYNDRILPKCGLKWSRPTQYLLDSMHDFLFRASIHASRPGDVQNFAVQRTTLTLLFRSNYNYLAAALLPMLAALLAVIAQLAGWRRLGRRVSLSPLEIAAAFGAPIMHRAQAAAAAGILARLGDRKVVYEGGAFVEISDVEQSREEAGSGDSSGRTMTGEGEGEIGEV